MAPVSIFRKKIMSAIILYNLQNIENTTKYLVANRYFRPKVNLKITISIIRHQKIAVYTGKAENSRKTEYPGRAQLENKLLKTL